MDESSPCGIVFHHCLPVGEFGQDLCWQHRWIHPRGSSTLDDSPVSFRMLAFISMSHRVIPRISWDRVFVHVATPYRGWRHHGVVNTEICGTAEDCSFEIHYYYICTYVYLSYLLPRILLLLRPPHIWCTVYQLSLALLSPPFIHFSSWDTLLSGGIVPAGYQLQTSCDSVSHYNYIDHALPARHERQLEQL